MSVTRDFLKGFALGLAKIAVDRMVFTGARVLGVVGFVSLIWWKPHIFGHPYAPFIGIAIIVTVGIAWRARHLLPKHEEKSGGGWGDLGASEER
ncbi:MAG: hypothetical protein AAFQ22_01620 [Pseudomonadota bacterium]